MLHKARFEAIVCVVQCVVGDWRLGAMLFEKLPPRSETRYCHHDDTYSASHGLDSGATGWKHRRSPVGGNRTAEECHKPRNRVHECRQLHEHIGRRWAGAARPTIASTRTGGGAIRSTPRLSIFVTQLAGSDFVSGSRCGTHHATVRSRTLGHKRQGIDTISRC